MEQITAYLAQLNTAANAVAAAAFAQNLGFTVAILSVDALRIEVTKASRAWTYIPFLLGVAAYTAVLVGCWTIENKLVDPSLAYVAFWLLLGRVTIVALSAVPVLLVMLAVRKPVPARSTGDGQ